MLPGVIWSTLNMPIGMQDRGFFYLTMKQYSNSANNRLRNKNFKDENKRCHEYFTTSEFYGCLKLALPKGKFHLVAIAIITLRSHSFTNYT